MRNVVDDGASMAPIVLVQPSITAPPSSTVVPLSPSRSAVSLRHRDSTLCFLLYLCFQGGNSGKKTILIMEMYNKVQLYLCRKWSEAIFNNFTEVLNIAKFPMQGQIQGR